MCPPSVSPWLQVETKRQIRTLLTLLFSFCIVLKILLSLCADCFNAVTKIGHHAASATLVHLYTFFFFNFVSTIN